MELEKICKYYNISRSRFKTEVKYRTKMPTITLKYCKWGCFDCGGYDPSCQNYSENTPEFINQSNKDYRYEAIPL